MSFIGIICESKIENHVKQSLSKKLIGYNVIFLNEKDIENYKNITFKIIVIMNNNKKVFSNKEIIFNLIKKTQYLILNSDEKIKLDFLKEIKLNVITYGFNAKSTVTASSVEEDEIFLCIQRNISSEKIKPIEPQEINIIKKDKKLTTSDMMAIAIILLICGKNEEKQY